MWWPTEFKTRDKEVRFDDFHGKVNVDKALGFLSQFEIAFLEEEYIEKYPN